MILAIKDELILIFYLLCYGVFVIASYDLFLFFLPQKRIKKYLAVIFEVLFWLIIILVTYQFSYRLYDGYMPLYYALFLIIGVLLYLRYLKKSMIDGANIVKRLIRHLLKPLRKVLLFLFYPKETLHYLKIPFYMMKKTSHDFWKSLKTEKKLIDKSLENNELLSILSEEQTKDIPLHV